MTNNKQQTTNSKPGYTLPVFACAAAIAALHYLRKPQPLESISLDLIEPPETVTIPIEQVAVIGEGMVLAVTKSNPGDNIDITRNTPIWALVEWGKFEQTEQVHLIGGEGIGKQLNVGGKAAIYAYAERLLQENLKRHLKTDERIQVTIILPEGAIARRTYLKCGFRCCRRTFSTRYYWYFPTFKCSRTIGGLSRRITTKI